MFPAPHRPVRAGDRPGSKRRPAPELRSPQISKSFVSYHPLLLLLRIGMAVPAVRVNRCVVMALVTELLLVGVTVHACVGKTRIICLAACVYIHPFAVPGHRI